MLLQMKCLVAELIGTLLKPSTDYNISIPMEPGQLRHDTTASWIKAEAQLRYFVRAISFLETFGNHLGVASFFWGTSVALGGFVDDLSSGDFWTIAFIVNIESARTFSRSNKSDDELLFKVTGGIKLKRLDVTHNNSYYLYFGIMMIALFGLLEVIFTGIIVIKNQRIHLVVRVATLVILSLLRIPKLVDHMKTHPILQFLPLVSVTGLFAVLATYQNHLIFLTETLAPLIFACVIHLCVLNNIISWQRIAPYCPLYLHKIAYVISRLKGLPVILFLPFLVARVFFFAPFSIGPLSISILFGSIVIENAQIPMSAGRITLSLISLSEIHHPHVKNHNFVPMLQGFYYAVFAQGTLYAIACVLEAFFSRIV